MHSNCVAALLLLCPLLITGCSEYNVSIVSPDYDSTFTDGDTVTFGMTLTMRRIGDYEDSMIYAGTIIQWTSSIDGPIWSETIERDIPASDHDDGWYATYDQQFSTSALSIGSHTVSCSARDKAGSKTIPLARASIAVHITSSPVTTTTTTPGPTSTTTTTGGGDLTAAECDAIHRIEVYAGDPEYYGPDCYAKIYVNNPGDQYINVISCQYDTHVSTINGCGCSVFSPGANTYIIDGGWIAATMSDGSTRTRETTIVAATYSVEGCAWTCNELADGTLDTPLSTIDVSGMNPCGGHVASLP
jgi:hypothetical protein